MGSFISTVLRPFIRWAPSPDDDSDGNEAFDGVAAAPLPAGLPLLLSGLATLGVFRGRVRRR
jgi:hypothetical protein